MSLRSILTLGVTGWRAGLFLLWWIICNVAVFMLGYLEQMNDPALLHLNAPIGTSIYFSRGAGLVLIFDAFFLLLPVCRNILSSMRNFKFVRGYIKFDKNIHFHKIVAWTYFSFSMVHIFAHLFNFKQVENLEILGPGKTALYLLYTHPAGITGVLMVVFFFLVYTSAMQAIRTHCFEMFWYTHHLGILGLIIQCVHSSGCFVKKEDGSCKPYGTYRLLMIPLIFYAIERVLRFARSRERTYISKIIKHPGDTFEIQFKKPQFSYETGQYVFVNFPNVRKFEWHPYTLSSCPGENFLSIHVKIRGDWSKAVAAEIGYYDPVPDLPVTTLPPILIDGPFGTPTQQVVDYEHVVLVACGVGITPYVSILKHLWFNHYDPESGQKVKTLHLFWVSRAANSFEWFQNLLKVMEQECQDGFLKIHIHMTGEVDQDHVHAASLKNDNCLDPITQLRSKTTFGRPNFDVYLKQIKESIRQSHPRRTHTAGIFFCGPYNFRKSLRNTVTAHSEDNFKLDFYAEKF
ncbi:hypothetical protein MP638_005608 [Amoeboaphelidium occidentale]|nr:hypothetical protein MP638_005608 [Amoeboaphelidium occidentale]